MSTFSERSYPKWKSLLQDESLPALVVDLDAFDRNVGRFRKQLEGTGKKVRIASKSIRVPFLLQRAAHALGEGLAGVMTYSVRESQALFSMGMRNLLVAYPIAQYADFVRVTEILAQDAQGITLTIDSVEHLELLKTFRERSHFGGEVNVCIDIDASIRRLGVHLGVQRSPLRTVEDLSDLMGRLKEYPWIRVVGVMTYEAQIAGLPDENPFHPFLNRPKKWIKAASEKELLRKRSGIVEALRKHSLSIDFFNGGGSGSFSQTLRDPFVTEVTVGSGLLQGHLFDYYQTNQSEPAEYFALRVTRIPEPSRTVTCQGGGYVASGEVCIEKQPIPWSPWGLESIATEGFGEVQTPLRIMQSARGGGVEAETLQVGDPVIFRPAKSGEIMERFDEVLLLSGDQRVDRVKTYRGLGVCAH